MGAVAKDAVSYIVVMRNLYIVKEDDVFEFSGVAHHTVVSNDGASSDKSAVSDFSFFTDDDRSFDKS
jgi:hypothetical protein